MGGGSFVPEQWEWRMCKNDAVTPTTFYAAEDNTTGVLDSNSDILRIRVDLRETGGVNGNITNVTIQYSTNDTDFTDLGSGNDWDWADGLGTHGNTCAAGGVLSGTNDPGYFYENGTSDNQLPKSDETENDFAITPTANVSTETKYYFRFVYNTTTVIPANSSHPQITTTIGSTAYTETPSDSETITDAGPDLDVGRSNADSLTISDSPTTEAEYARSLSDTQNITDSPSLEPGIPLSDNQTFLDSISIGQWIPESDSVGLADSISLEPGVGEADTVTLSDAITLVTEFALSLSDTLTIADVYSDDSAPVITDWKLTQHDYVRIIDRTEWSPNRRWFNIYK